MKQVHILLAEDNEGDIMLTREAFEAAKISIHLSVVKDGKEAIDFMNQQGPYINENLPDLILLDINMPKKNGHEVLKHVKENKHLKHIPVIMLTTSSAEKDINTCYDNHVNCFITKPIDVNEFLADIATIENFWISIVKLHSNKLIANDKG